MCMQRRELIAIVNSIRKIYIFYQYQSFWDLHQESDEHLQFRCKDKEESKWSLACTKLLFLCHQENQICPVQWHIIPNLHRRMNKSMNTYQVVPISPEGTICGARVACTLWVLRRKHTTGRLLDMSSQRIVSSKLSRIWSRKSNHMYPFVLTLLQGFFSENMKASGLFLNFGSFDPAHQDFGL